MFSGVGLELWPPSPLSSSVWSSCLFPDKIINFTHEPGPSEVLIQRGLAGILAAVSGFILGLSSCFPPLFLPLRRWAEFHTEEDAPFVGSISN